MLNYIKTHYKIAIPVGIVLLLLIGVITFAIINNILSGNDPQTGNRTEDVIAVDYSNMSTEEIFDWCAEHEVSCSISTDFSDSVEEGKYVGQDVKPGDVIKPGQTVNVDFSQGIIPSEGRYRECVEAVVYYVNRDHMSYKGAYDFFLPEYKEDVTQWSVDHAKIDWNTIALARAVEIHNNDTKDKGAIRGKLLNEKFTLDQANFAINNLDGTLASQS